jgi:hypothetical protein
MLDHLAFAMSHDALRRQYDRFEATGGRPPASTPSSVGRVRLGVARRLRAVADRIEPVGSPANADTPTVTLDRRDAA